MSVDLNTAITQLVDPDPIKLVLLTGLRLPAVDNLGFRAPHDICKSVEPVDESNVQVYLTPDHLFVDLREDAPSFSVFQMLMLVISRDNCWTETSLRWPPISVVLHPSPRFLPQIVFPLLETMRL